MTARHKWTDRDVALLRAQYPDTKTELVAAVLGMPIGKVYTKAHALGLKKSAAFLASDQSGRLEGQRGESHRYGKGHVPANKGLRRPGYARGRMTETQFKKGGLPHTTVPIGTERFRMGYWWVKVRDDLRPMRKCWISKHQHLYEQAHGPIPAKHLVRFKDGNRQNLTLENLECVSRSQHASTKGLQVLPPDIKQIHILRAAITRHIHKHRPPAPKKRTGRPRKERAVA